MDLYAFIIMAVLIAALAVVVFQRDNLARKLAEAQALREPRLIFRAERRPEDLPPGTISLELALAVHEEWRKAGYHMLGDTRVVLRLLSIAHRVMCIHQAASLAPALYNDGDRSPPAKVACVAEGKRGCTWPDCHCEAIPDTPPPLRPKPNQPGKI